MENKKMKKTLTNFFAGCLVSIALLSPVNISHAITNSCLIGPTSLSGTIFPTQRQGIKGHVVKLSGNHMPPARPPHAKTELIATKVWIFSGKIRSYIDDPSNKILVQKIQQRWSLKEARKHPSLLGWTTSNSQGYFQVGLPPGEYTLFAEYADYLYLNAFNTDGSYGSIQIKEDQLIQIRLINNEDSMS
jgi:hypothetical protein